MQPYLTTESCVERLYQQYKTHPKLIVAVDFDDTVFDFHKKGFTYEKTVDILKRCQAAGFYIVCFTASPKERFEFIKGYFDGLGITITGINANAIESDYGKNGKIFFNILLDDRAGLGQAIETLEALFRKIELKTMWQEAERV